MGGWNGAGASSASVGGEGAVIVPGLKIGLDAGTSQVTANSDNFVRMFNNGVEHFRMKPDGRLSLGEPAEFDAALGKDFFPCPGIDLEIHRNQYPDGTMHAPIARLDHAREGEPAYMCDSWPVVENAIVGQLLCDWDGNHVGRVAVVSGPPPAQNINPAGKYSYRQWTNSDNRTGYGDFDCGAILFETAARRDDGTGTYGLKPRMKITHQGNIQIYNTAAVPSTNASNGGYLYVENGALKYRGKNGTVTTIANA
jgi:hypothetical protein